MEGNHREGTGVQGRWWTLSTLAIADIHGNIDALVGLLSQEGVINGNRERIDRESTIIQIGDLCNSVASSVGGDRACLDEVERWLDVYLVGNHEHSYFGGPRFAGFWPVPEIGHKLQLLNSLGKMQAAYAVDDILITHAGVIRDAVLDEDHEPGTAEDWAVALNDLWQQNTIHPIFSTIGKQRGGAARYGGVLWSDFGEAKSQNFPQIFGHTIGDTVRLKRKLFPNAWGPPKYPFEIDNGDVLCIDLEGDRLAAAWIRDGFVEVVYYEGDSEISE